MKICVVGAGAIGGLCVAWLSKLGDIELCALARGQTLAQLRKDGLRFESTEGQTETIALRTSDQPQELGVQDLIIVSVKAPSLAAVASQVAQMMDAKTMVLVAMNGVPWWFFDALPGAGKGLRLQSSDPADRVRVCIPTSQVIGCVVHIASTNPNPGIVKHVMGNGLIIGEAFMGASTRVQELANVLTRAGFAITQSERIQQDIWYKLWGNMTMNPVSVLTQARSDDIQGDDLVREFSSAVMREANTVGARIGLPIEQTPEERHLITRKLGSFKTSMLQDFEAQRPLELDALVGSVREIAQHVKVATPFLDALFGMSRLLAKGKSLY